MTILVWLSKSPVESPSCHNGFPLDLEDHKNQMELPPIFSVRVWSVIRRHVLKLGIEIPNLKQHN